MTKSRKGILITLLTCVFALTTFISIMGPPKEAKALSTTPIQEGTYFEMLPGAAIKSGVKTTITMDGREFLDSEKTFYSLGFFMEPTSDYVHWKKLSDFAEEWRDEKIRLGWAMALVDVDTTYQAYEFKLRRKGISDSELVGEATEDVVSMRIVFGYSWNAEESFEYAVSIKRHDASWSEENFVVPTANLFADGEERIGEILNTKLESEAKKDGFSIIECGYTDQEGLFYDANGECAFEILVDSFVENFDVIFNYTACRGANYGKRNYKNYDEEIFKNTVQISDTRSVQQVLTMLNDDGVLEENVSEDALSLAQEIISDEKFKTVKIRYLEEIEGTPFAEKKEITLKEFPVAGRGISKRDVFERTGKDFKIFETGASSFVLKSEDLESSVYVFDAFYLKDSLFTATTKEGKDYEFFFNLNISFKEAFAPPMNETAPLITNDHYQYAWGQLQKTYPALMEGDYKDTNVFGRFGFVSIPDVKTSIAGFVSSIFGKETEALNLKTMWSKQSSITREQFSALINDYGYSADRLYWEEAFMTGDSHEATHYMFYAAPGESSIKEKEPITDGIGKGIKEIWRSYGKLLTSLGGIMNDVFGSKAGVSVLLVVAGVGVLVYFYFQSGGSLGSLTKGKSGKDPSTPKLTSLNMFGGKKKSKPRRTAKRKKSRKN